jgi:tetratricopeptide (TPR) repeat protein
MPDSATTTRWRSLTFAALAVAIIAGLGGPVVWRRWNDYRRTDLASQCRLVRTARKWDELQALANDWTRWDPQNGEAWLNRGAAAGGRQDWDDAAEAFWQVPDSSPQAIPAMIELSQLAFSHLNRPLKGVEACERILRIDPLAAGARQQLIWFYAMTLQRAKLRQQILESVKRRREPREAYVYYFLLYTLRSQAAVELNARWLQDDPESELYLVARVINLPEPQAGSPETLAPISTEKSGLDARPEKTKLEQVEELLAQFPQNLELIAYKAEERFENGDFLGAGEILKNSPDAAAQDSRFWRFKGWLHEANHELEAAVAAYRQALELHPMDWNTINRLAIVERLAKNPVEVKRLSELLDRANEARKNLRKQKAIEIAAPQVFEELLALFRDCGETDIAHALESRLAAAQRN